MTATLPSTTDLRDCHLYRFWVRHPITGERVLGYVGETVRQPLQRLIEHLYEQPWADTIIAWEVDEVVYPGKDAVLAAEKFAVETELPSYNHEWNLNNPRRVEIWRAREQRWARDDAAGRVRWVKPVKQPRGQSDMPARQSTPIVPERRVKWSPVRVAAALWSISWAASSTVVWAVLARNAWLQSTMQRALCASIVCLVALLLSRWLTPQRRRRLAKAWRKLRRWFV